MTASTMSSTKGLVMRSRVIEEPGPHRADEDVDDELLVDAGVELVARDRAVEDAPVGEPPGVDDGLQQVGDLGVVTGLADQPRHEGAVAVGEDDDGAREQRVKVAAQGAGYGDVDGLQASCFDGGGRDGGFGRPAPEDRGLGDARALRQLVETEARVAAAEASSSRAASRIRRSIPGDGGRPRPRRPAPSGSCSSDGSARTAASATDSSVPWADPLGRTLRAATGDVIFRYRGCVDPGNRRLGSRSGRGPTGPPIFTPRELSRMSAT